MYTEQKSGKIFFLVPLIKETKEIIPLIKRKQKLFSLFFPAMKVNFICRRSSGLIALKISLLYEGNAQGVPKPSVWNRHFQVCEHSLCPFVPWLLGKTANKHAGSQAVLCKDFQSTKTWTFFHR